MEAAPDLDPKVRERLAHQLAFDAATAAHQWVRHPRYYEQVREWMVCGWLGWHGIKRRDGHGVEAD